MIISLRNAYFCSRSAGWRVTCKDSDYAAVAPIRVAAMSVISWSP